MLPSDLATIFKNKQKSYKMVLVLSFINHYEKTKSLTVTLNEIAESFLNYYRGKEELGFKIDLPPKGEASSWKECSLGQIRNLLKTPIDALSSIIEYNSLQQTLSFKAPVKQLLNEKVLQELKEYAERELESYNNQLASSSTGLDFSLQGVFQEVFKSYLEAKTQSFAGHQLGTLFRQTLPNELKKLAFMDDHYKIQGSIGMGNWATVPWLAIMDKRVTDTTQKGEYVVYLFSEDMSSVYLTLAQGVTVPTRDLGKKQGYSYLEQKVAEMRGLLPLQGMKKDDQIFLTSSGLGRDYQVSTVAYYRYDRNNLPDDEQLITDLKNVMDNYRLYVDRQTDFSEDDQNSQMMGRIEPMDPQFIKPKLNEIKAFIKQNGFHYPDPLIENFYLSLKTKPFVILAGISGTGKTKLVKLFAESVGATGENGQFTLIPVRPDWNDPSDLIGYQELSGRFKPGRLTEVLVTASLPENRNKPYFICLDEMNLARVEHYFSDLLSLLETQRWMGGQIVTEPLIPNASLDRLEDQELYGDLGIPENVYLIGTVNMDETTYPFSKKVLDRANTLEFNHIDLTQLPWSEGDEEQESVEIAPVSQRFFRADYLNLVNVDAENKELVKRTTDKLVAINQILEEIHAQVGFRIRDTISFYSIYAERFGLLTEDDAFDLQLLQKILPRIQGSHTSVKRVLLKLLKVCLEGESLKVNDLLDDASSLYSRWDAGKEAPAAKYPQSARKLAFMLRRLEEDGFTSFWLS